MSSAIHPAALPAAELLSDCTMRRQRRSGPGGQHRNKVETAVVITHQPTGIRGEASERRSQEANRQVALFRLRVQLALRVRQPIDVATAPSTLWQSRSRSGRIAVNPRHDDFPALLAEGLDRVVAVDGDPARAAASLGVTASQLLRLFRQEPAALAQLNRLRAELDLHPLK